MRPSAKRLVVLGGVSLLILTSIVGVKSFGQDSQWGFLIMRVGQQKLELKGTAGDVSSSLSGEIVYRFTKRGRVLTYELYAANLRAGGIETKRGKTGNISIGLRPKSGTSKYDGMSLVIDSEFLVDVHYPLIDRVKGYVAPKKEELEDDDKRSLTETFQGTLSVKLAESPRLKKSTEKTKLRGGAEISLKLDLKDMVLAEVTSLKAKFSVVDVVVVGPYFFIQSAVKIQPVFIRYTPATGCFGGSTTATTGGSYPTLRDNAISMWNRCCLKLTFLEPVYVSNDDYRILSSSEDSALMGSYDDANAIEVFFAEIGDPVGLYGGGVCYSGGTSNTQIITYDTNLPINIYNLAHELGHAFGLGHPPGNSTSGSLMEPSGFCRDNPALMSNQNCDNVSNPLFYWVLSRIKCNRNVNM
jgi:hypothetical protein